jgi:hypothetical protein
VNAVRRPLRLALYGVGALLLLTGIAWAVLHYLPGWLGRSEREAQSANAFLMKVHGAAAMLALMLLGSLAADHVFAGWRAARNRVSGLTMLLLTFALIVTGYLLYYSGGEDTRELASMLHLGAGALLPAIVFVHALRLVRARRRHAALARAVHRKAQHRRSDVKHLGLRNHRRT